MRTKCAAWRLCMGNNCHCSSKKENRNVWRLWAGVWLTRFFPVDIHSFQIVADVCPYSLMRKQVDNPNIVQSAIAARTDVLPTVGAWLCNHRTISGVTGFFLSAIDSQRFCLVNTFPIRGRYLSCMECYVVVVNRGLGRPVSVMNSAVALRYALSVAERAGLSLMVFPAITQSR